MLNVSICDTAADARGPTQGRRKAEQPILQRCLSSIVSLGLTGKPGTAALAACPCLVQQHNAGSGGSSSVRLCQDLPLQINAVLLWGVRLRGTQHVRAPEMRRAWGTGVAHVSADLGVRQCKTVGALNLRHRVPISRWAYHGKPRVCQHWGLKGCRTAKNSRFWYFAL